MDSQPICLAIGKAEIGPASRESLVPASVKTMDKPVGTDRAHVPTEAPWEEGGSHTEDIAFPSDPAKLQKRLKLELPSECMEYLRNKSERSGRSINELIMQMINDCLVQEN